MITEEKVEKCLQWLVDNANVAAQARANKIYCEEYRKVVLAEQMTVSGESSAAAQERSALNSTPYKDHLIALQEAVREDYKLGWLRGTAEATIEAYRTMQANQRAQGKL